MTLDELKAELKSVTDEITDLDLDILQARSALEELQERLSDLEIHRNELEEKLADKLDEMDKA